MWHKFSTKKAAVDCHTTCIQCEHHLKLLKQYAKYLIPDEKDSDPTFEDEIYKLLKQINKVEHSLNRIDFEAKESVRRGNYGYAEEQKE